MPPLDCPNVVVCTSDVWLEAAGVYGVPGADVGEVCVSLSTRRRFACGSVTGVDVFEAAGVDVVDTEALCMNYENDHS